MPVKPEEAFQNYCRQALIQQALGMTKGGLNESLLKDAFMAGAGYAIERCKAEHHQPKKSGP